ncbi:hypothetical protein MUK42_00211 [Musa troglodytarum]|uniref:Uncharacterized protein n=1 Tax=Musa troglodytarum TaxID=320322 RepID=A0A9E7FFY8_9LILI|nr:hypothetical protein MUK42_00211 [Musa troglodytarum]
MKKAIEEAGFLESYTLHVPHPPNNRNFGSLPPVFVSLAPSNPYPISELTLFVFFFGLIIVDELMVIPLVDPLVLVHHPSLIR